MSWIGDNWVWLLPLVIAVVQIVNKATVHWSELEGPWYKRMLPTVLLVLTELASVLPSKGVAGLKLPLTSKPPKKGSGGRDGASVLVLLLLPLLAASACASWQKPTAVALNTTYRATVEVHSASVPYFAGKCLEAASKGKTAWQKCDGQRAQFNRLTIVVLRSLDVARASFIAAVATDGKDKGQALIAAIRELLSEVETFRKFASAIGLGGKLDAVFAALTAVRGLL